MIEQFITDGENKRFTLLLNFLGNILYCFRAYTYKRNMENSVMINFAPSKDENILLCTLLQTGVVCV